MVDAITFIFQQFFNIFMVLDNITIVGTLTLLRLLIVISLFIFIFNIIGGKKND